MRRAVSARRRERNESMAETNNSNTNNALDGGAGGELAYNGRVQQDIAADIKAGPGTGKPKPAPAPKRHTIVPTRGGKRR